MSDDSRKPDEFPERRLMVRYPSTAEALVLRDADPMRTGSEAKLHDVSCGGVGLRMKAGTPALGEQVKIRLQNPIQKFHKEIRGVVRHVTPRDEGTFHIGIEFFNRLTPLEVSLLKMSLAGNSQDGSTWL